jgi:signal transduction histidine kinase
MTRTGSNPPRVPEPSTGSKRSSRAEPPRRRGSTGQAGQKQRRRAEERARRKTAEIQLRAERERLRALASQLSVAEERERRRLAATLHDQVGQLLALSRLKLAALREEAGGAGLAGPVDEVTALVDEALAATRSLTSELAPPVLYRLGLEAAVEWYGERLREQSGFTVHCAERGTPAPLGDDLRGFLFAAARELLHNVVKHAHAGSARVLLDWHGEVLVLTVEDDGAGFEPEARAAPDDPACFGLFSIRERTSDLGGRLEVEAAPGQGTRVKLLVPVAPPGVRGRTT